jgi:hypothetical protein
MAEYKPSRRKQFAIIAGFLAFSLPWIVLTARAYSWISIRWWLHVSESVESSSGLYWLLSLLVVAGVCPVTLIVTLLALIPWMFLMSRWLPWRDVEYFSRQRTPRIPLLSNWLDRLWAKMIAHRRSASSPSTDQG